MSAEEVGTELVGVSPGWGIGLTPVDSRLRLRGRSGGAFDELAIEVDGLRGFGVPGLALWRGVVTGVACAEIHGEAM